ncbi:MAG: hypothetical protein V1738_04160 [Patescibacteria group bacterium]
MKTNQQPPDYKKKFIMGTIFMGAGVALAVTVGATGFAMMFIGGIMIFIGARHRSKCK